MPEGGGGGGGVIVRRVTTLCVSEHVANTCVFRGVGVSGRGCTLKERLSYFLNMFDVGASLREL